MIGSGRADIGPGADLLEESIELIRPYAEHVGCVAEVEHARTMIARGTSARRQREIYTDAVEKGASPRDALLAVADLLIAHTVPGEKSAV